MSARSFRAAGPTLLGLVPQLAYTSPPGIVSVLKTWGFTSINVATLHVAVFAGAVPGISTQIMEVAVPGSGGALVTWTFVLRPGEDLWWNSDAAVASVTANVSGMRVPQ